MDAVRGNTFDVIFMDLQMPNMDGLAATAHIRAHQQAKAAWRAPIVGLTANAFVEDRARCLAAGMDDYMSKPFTEEQLQAVLSRWISDKQRKIAMTPPVLTISETELTTYPISDAGTAAVAMPALDTSMIEGLRRGRPDLLKRLLKAYLGYAPKAVECLKAATAEGSIEAVRMAAHSLKSSSASMGATVLSALFKELEHSAATGQIEAITPLMMRVSVEFERVHAALSGLNDEPEPRKVAQA